MASRGDGTVRVLQWDGTHLTQTASHDVAVAGGEGLHVVLGDVDGDGFTDLLAVTSGGHVQVWRNTLVPGDADGDGIDDLTEVRRGLDCRHTDAACADVPGGDTDGDGICQVDDRCPYTNSADNGDDDGDGVGNACDCAPGDDDPRAGDIDGDGVCDDVDNCRYAVNPSQQNSDGAQGDPLGDVCDCAPDDPTPNANDSDGDQVCNSVDNCPTVANPQQADEDKDGVGDDCEVEGTCEYQPVAFEFEPRVKCKAWEDFGGPASYVPPVVSQLTDDNGDGVVDERDTPDIVFVTISSHLNEILNDNALLHVISDDDCSEEFTVSPPAGYAYRTMPLVADVDADGKPEILALRGGIGYYGAVDSTMDIIANDGTIEHSCHGDRPDIGWQFNVADLDRDGMPEILSSSGDIWHADCSHYARIEGAGGVSQPLVVDLDLDGDLEIVSRTTIFDHTGAPIGHLQGEPATYLAAADVTGDANPEILSYNSTFPFALVVRNFQGQILWTYGADGVADNNAPILLANLDDDPQAEILSLRCGSDVDSIPYSCNLIALDGDGSSMWPRGFRENSPRTQAFAVDLDGDGKLEIAYHDYEGLSVLDGATGERKYQILEPSYTNLEGPTPADTNGDGRGDILSLESAEDGSGTDTGTLTVFEGAGNSYASMRPIWNQWNYVIGNVDEVGHVRADQAQTQRFYNSMNRQSAVPGVSTHAAPDLVPVDVVLDGAGLSEGDATLWVRMANIGDAPVASGAPIALYDGDPLVNAPLIGVAHAPGRIYAGDWVDLSVAWSPNPSTGPRTVYAVADDTGGTNHNLNYECVDDNNKLSRILDLEPACITDLSAAPGDAGIDLVWTEASGAESIAVERSGGTTEGSLFADLTSLDGAATGYSDGTTSSGESYLYRLRITQTGGGTCYSNIASISTAGSLAVHITNPHPPDLSTASATITVDGTVSDAGVQFVRVNGHTATLTGNTWHVEGIPLAGGPNLLHAVAQHGALTATHDLTIERTTGAPLSVAISTPHDGDVFNTQVISVTGTVNDVRATVTVGGAPMTVDPTTGNWSGSAALPHEGANALVARATLGGTPVDSAPVTVQLILDGELRVVITNPADPCPNGVQGCDPPWVPVTTPTLAVSGIVNAQNAIVTLRTYSGNPDEPWVPIETFPVQVTGGAWSLSSVPILAGNTILEAEAVLPGVPGAAYSYRTVQYLPADDPPFVSIDAIGADTTFLGPSEVTQPTSITVTVQDTNLAWWKLEVANTSDGVFEPVYTPTSPTQSVTAAELVDAFDPTMLRNGLYRLRLTAQDQLGQRAWVEEDVLVAGNMKVGNFSLTFQDLSLPLPGIAVQVQRSYDSRSAAAGDFGPAWTLGVKTIQLQETVPPGVGFRINGDGTIDEIGRSHEVVVTLPDGRQERFAFEPEQIPGGYARPKWVNRNNDGAVLIPQVPNESDLIYQIDPQTGRHTLYYPDGDFTPYDPSTYVLQTYDGTRYEIDQTTGLVSIEDSVPNRVTIDRDGIHHSSGVEIQFHRDSAAFPDFITSITDPDGNTWRYDYDNAGRLWKFTDPVLGNPDTRPAEANQHPYVEFRYENPDHPHYLTQIIDPRGNAVARTYYDGAGRVEWVCDASAGSTAPPTSPAGDAQTFPGCSYMGHNVGARTETIVDRNGNESRYVYDDRGNVIEEHGPAAVDSPITRHVYDPRDNELTTIAPTGEVTKHTYNTRDQVLTTVVDPSSYTGPSGEPETNTHCAPSGCLNLVTSNEYFEHAGLEGLLKKTTDPRGRETSYTYYTDGGRKRQVKDVEDPGHTITHFDYNTNTGMPSSVTVDPGGLGITTSTGYDSKGNLTSSTDAEGHTTTYESFTAGGQARVQKVTRTRPDETSETLVTRTEYDALGRTIRSYDPVVEGAPLGDFSVTTYNAAGQVASTTDKRNNPTTHEYDDLGRLKEVHYADGTSEEYRYDANNNRVKTRDRDGFWTTTVYDALSRVVATYHGDTAPENPNSSIPHASTDYDASGRVTDTYDESYNATNGTAGSHTSFEYDNAGRRTKVHQHVEDDRVLTTTTTYYEDGRTHTVTDALGHTTTYADAFITTGNEQGREETVTLANNSTTVTHYDRAGRRTWTRDQANRVTSFDYFPTGRLHAVHQPLHDLSGTFVKDVVTWFGYDELGNRTRQVDAKAANENDATRTTFFEYDRLGRLAKKIYPANADGTHDVERYEYDANGNRTDKYTETIDGSGAATITLHTSAHYDEMNRMEYEQSSADNERHTYTYGFGSGAPYRSRLSKVESQTVPTETDPGTFLRSLEYTYSSDGRGHIETQATSSAGHTETVHFEYDAVGTRTAVWSTGAGGATVYPRIETEPDKLNRPHILHAGTAQDPRDVVITYDDVGNRQQITYPNGLKTVYDYDSLNRLDVLTHSIGNTVLARYDYAVGPAGNRTDLVESAGATTTRTLHWDYDSLYRLGREQIAGVQTGEWDYDEVGNRITERKTVGTTTTTADLSYSPADQLTSKAVQGGSTSNYTWQVGRLQNAGGAQQTWNAWDRMQSHTQGSDATSYTYAPDGILEQKVWPAAATGAMTSRFVYDRTAPYAQLLQEWRDDGAGGNLAVVADYLYTDGDLLGFWDRNNPAEPFYWILKDGQNSVRKVVDEQGNEVASYDYDAWGKTLSDTQPASWMLNHRAFGEWSDPNSGYTYLRARWMDPGTGRFGSLDPLVRGFHELNRFLHPYSYVENNPVNAIDPSGLFGQPSHYMMTYNVLTEMGFDPIAADLVAKWDRALDSVSAFDDHAKHCTRAGGWFSNAPEESVETARANSHAYQDSQFARAVSWAQNYGRPGITFALQDFGELLHSVQDEVAHKFHVIFPEHLPGGGRGVEFFELVLSAMTPDEIAAVESTQTKLDAENATRAKVGAFLAAVGGYQDERRSLVDSLKHWTDKPTALLSANYSYSGIAAKTDVASLGVL